MPDEEQDPELANLDDEELAEAADPVFEDEDESEFGLEPDEGKSASEPTDLPGGVEDDSGFLEEMVDESDPVLEQPEGTRVGGDVP